MNQGRLIVGLVVVVIAAVVLSSSFYTVDMRQWALVTRFGKVLKADDKPGLHWKTPFVDSVRYYDKQILTLDAEPQRYLTEEKKTLIVDSFVKWRIVDPLKFYLTVGGSEANARTRLQQVINGGLRTEFGKRPLHAVVSGDRQEIMDILRVSADKAAREFGIEVVDVRLQRVDLPDEVSQSVYRRMEAERTRIAKDHRARGAEAAEKIKAEADRKSQVIKAEAYRDAQQIRGEGDAKAIDIYARSLRVNPSFYQLYRSLEAYKKTFRSKDDVLILDPSSEFFRYLKNSQPR
ncbi:MAG: protease modulator HflC [Acidiferrobacteraceae bacterium]|jgi:membrane protease subunit HflC